MENFFKSALDDPDLQLKLREDGNIFFLHLLGCDTNGHVHKPHSAHYRDNINTVDEGVRIVPQIDPSEKLYSHGEGPY